MSKHDEFMAVVNTLKSASPTITAEQRIGLLRQAVQQHGLSVDEAAEILEASGLVIGEKVNYFEILGLSIEEIQDQGEAAIAARVDTAHEQHYNASLRAGGRVRPDGRTEEQWRILLNHARDALKDTKKREEHIVDLQRDTDDTLLKGSAPPIFKFSNGDEATSIPELADLMAKNAKDATHALYHGYLEQSLGRVGEMHFATAAQAVAKEFPNDRELGRKAIVDILKGKMTFEKGSEARMPKQFGQEMEAQKPNEAGTPKQIALMIDRNWEQAKTLLYSGFIALWFEYTKHLELANIAKKINSRYGDDQDVGLEMLVQELDSQIGQPELEMSHTHIDFGKVDTETQATLQVEIKNRGRGFLYGDVQLVNEMPGLQLSAASIRDEAVVTVELDASLFTAKQRHETELVVSTNSGRLEVPIACYVDYPIWKSIRRCLISGAAVAMVTLAPRLIVLLLTDAEWLSTRFTSAGFVHFESASDLNNLYYQREIGLWQYPVALVSIGIGIFAYWFLFFKKYGSFFSKKKGTH